MSLRDVPGRGSASTVTLSHTGADASSMPASPLLRAPTAAAPVLRELSLDSATEEDNLKTVAPGAMSHAHCHHVQQEDQDNTETHGCHLQSYLS